MTDSAKQILELYNLIKKYQKDFKGDKLSFFIISSKLLEQIGEIANKEKDNLPKEFDCRYFYYIRNIIAHEFMAKSTRKSVYDCLYKQLDRKMSVLKSSKKVGKK